MAKINANGNISYLLSLVFMVLSSTAGAARITFYSNKDDCLGPGLVIDAADENTCYSYEGASVQFSAMNTCQTGFVYTDFACGGTLAGYQAGNGCIAGKHAKSARWYTTCAIVKSDKTACMSKANPTSVVYAEHSKEGTWVLKCSNAFEMFSTLESLPEAEKVNWLKDNGAVFVPTSVVV